VVAVHLNLEAVHVVVREVASVAVVLRGNTVIEPNGYVTVVFDELKCLVIRNRHVEVFLQTVVVRVVARISPEAVDVVHVLDHSRIGVAERERCVVERPRGTFEFTSGLLVDFQFVTDEIRLFDRAGNRRAVDFVEAFGVERSFEVSGRVHGDDVLLVPVEGDPIVVGGHDTAGVIEGGDACVVR
jgi:hypothetical protein